MKEIHEGHHEECTKEEESWNTSHAILDWKKHETANPPGAGELSVDWGIVTGGWESEQGIFC